MRYWKLTGLIAAGISLMVFMGRLSPLEARVTGVNPTGSSADTWCDGSVGNEVCVDYLGDVIPTTTNDTSLGTTSFLWANVYATIMTPTTLNAVTANVSGSLIKTEVSTITVTATGNNPLISASGACGGILRLTPANANVTSAGFTAPSAANAGCILYVVNVGSSGGGTISFVTSATFIAPSVGGNSKDIVLGTNDAFVVGQVNSAWMVLGSVVINN